MKKDLIFLLLFLFSVTCLVAQQTTFTGVVVNDSGIPLENVRVSINGSPFTKTDASGNFTFTLSHPDLGVTTVLAELKGHQRGEYRWSSDTSIEIIMLPLSSFGGQVLDQSKQPVKGVSVRIVKEDLDVSAETDTSGLFNVYPPHTIAIDANAEFYVRGKKVDPSDLIFASDDYFVQIGNQEQPEKIEIDVVDTIKKEEDSKEGFQPMSVTILFENGLAAKNIRAYLGDVEYQSDAQGQFIVNDPLTTPESIGDIKFAAHEMVIYKYDKETNELVVHIAEKAVAEDSVDVSKLLDTSVDDTVVVEYREDFNIVLTQLEIRKQTLNENSIRIKKEMEKIAEKLNNGQEELSEEQRHILTEDLLQLESALIKNEQDYEQAQLETRKLLDAMKNTLETKDLQLTEIKEELSQDIIVFIVTVLILVSLVGIFYAVASRIRKQKEEIEASYRNIQTIGEVGQKITATLDFENLIQIIHKNVNSLLDATVFGVGITNEAVNKIEFKKYIEKGETQSYFYESLDDHNKFSVWCLHNQKEVVINDLASEYTKYIYKEAFTPTEDMPKSLIYLPLIIENKSIGVITVQSYRKNAYKELDTTILRTLASYVSIALANSNAFEVIREKNRNITNSIRYAQTIQEAILPSDNAIGRNFGEHFIFYKPKDIVSGDFYWFSKVEAKNGEPERLYIAAVDCTGHGVPGAFMSMIGNTLLDETINQLQIYDTAQILENLNVAVKEALNQENKTNDDGMDVCLCCIEKQNGDVRLSFTGAKRPLYYYERSTGKIDILKGDAKTIGGLQRKKRTFNRQELILKAGDVIYLTSDGLVDQSNPMREKFGTKRFLKLLESNAELSMIEQERIIKETLIRFQASADQRDDMLVVGVKL
ncbi:MAG: SpoIIE family protein phosphatase [Flammeovirgaceae bacterium]